MPCCKHITLAFLQANPTMACLCAYVCCYHMCKCCRQEVLVRFWLQSVSRITSAAWEEAVCPALQPLLRVTLDVYDAMVQQR